MTIGARLRALLASRWLRRAGAAGFVFFFVKGLFWLALFAWAASAADCSRKPHNEQTPAAGALSTPARPSSEGMEPR